MSLLLKALQRASKSRESAVATPAGPAASRPAAGGAAAAAAGSIPARAPGAPTAARDLNFTSRPKGSNLFTRAAEPADLAEAASAASVDAGALRAERFSVVEWARENPVYVFAIAVLVFLVFYFAYVFLAINYPGIFTRSSGFTAPSGAQIQPLARTSGPAPTGPITAPPPADLPPPPMPSISGIRLQTFPFLNVMDMICINNAFPASRRKPSRVHTAAEADRVAAFANAMRAIRLLDVERENKAA